MSLVPAIFWRRHALPSRIALRMLWVILRLDFVLDAVPNIYDNTFSFTIPGTQMYQTLQTPFITSGGIVVVFALVLTPGVRRRIQGSSAASAAAPRTRRRRPSWRR